jgi:hypothetical protein
MSIPPHADTDSKEGKVPEKAKAAVLVESVPLPEGTPTVKGSKPLIYTCRIWYRAKSGNLDYYTLTLFAVLPTFPPFLNIVMNSLHKVDARSEGISFRRITFRTTK